MPHALPAALVTQSAVQRLDGDTQGLRTEADAETVSLIGASTPDQYRRYLGRAYGFIAPLERSLLDTPGLEQLIDVRRFRKHALLEHDLQTLGMKPLEVQSLPQCMWIPWFDDVHTALGWAYVIERNTLEHPNLFRYLASVMPGEAAFGASFLKCYSAAIAQMWRSFDDSLGRAAKDLDRYEAILAGAKAGFRYFRRWRNTLDGKSVSGPQELSAELPTFDEISVTNPESISVACLEDA